MFLFIGNVASSFSRGTWQDRYFLNFILKLIFHLLNFIYARSKCHLHKFLRFKTFLLCYLYNSKVFLHIFNTEFGNTDHPSQYFSLVILKKYYTVTFISQVKKLLTLALDSLVWFLFIVIVKRNLKAIHVKYIKICVYLLVQ